MPNTINNTSQSLQLYSRRDNPNTEFNRISSGQRINSAADDAAGLAIATRFSTAIGGFNTSIRNAGDGISLSQTAGGGLDSIKQNLQRIRELSLQAANGTLNAQDRQALQAEADQLTEANQSVLEQANFNGVKLFDSDDPLSFQVGPEQGDTITVSGRNLNSELDELGINTLDLSTASGASNALNTIDEALSRISERETEYGSIENRFESTIDTLQQANINAQESRSRIADADIAQEAANLTAKNIRNQAQIAVQAQANANAGLTLRLLGQG